MANFVSPTSEMDTALFDAHAVKSPSSVQEAKLRAVKHGDAFALFDNHGDVAGAENAPEGVYFKDTRQVSFWRLSICGASPMLLGAGIDDRVDALIVDLTNPALTNRFGENVPPDTIHISRLKFLHEGSAYERLAVRNFDRSPHRFSLEQTLGADFRDMFEIRGDKRDAKGERRKPTIEHDGIDYQYFGLDEIVRRTSISFSPKPDFLAPHRASFAIALRPGERKVIYCRISLDGQDASEPIRSCLEAYRALRAGRRDARKAKPRMSSANATFDEMIAQSLADLTTLTTNTPQGPAAYAGIPWYCTLFGRDSLITALQAMWYNPALAKGTLKRLAHLQAEVDDPSSDAEPGKILHEMRSNEMANTGEIPFRRYYGSVDSTPLFVFLAGEYIRYTGDINFVDEIWPNLEAATRWITDYGDRDNDGFYEYGRRMDTGLQNQGWKDSYDAISHQDGRLAEGPIALVEMQAYVYGAWKAMAELCKLRGNRQSWQEWEERAAVLKRNFATRFFDEDLGTYILALDGEKRPCRVVASNAGHALLTGIAQDDHARAVAARLLAPDCFSGWGVRTLASSERRYNPMSYHNGSIWPHDNALIAAGFSRYGLNAAAAEIFEALFSAADYFDQRRLPELFCGFSRRKGRGPTLYPVACAPQAWSSGAPLMLIKAVLGMDLATSREVRFDNPTLPGFLSSLIIENLGSPQGQVDLELRQMGMATSVFVQRRDEGVKVTVTA